MIPPPQTALFLEAGTGSEKTCANTWSSIRPLWTFLFVLQISFCRPEPPFKLSVFAFAISLVFLWLKGGPSISRPSLRINCVRMGLFLSLALQDQHMSSSGLLYVQTNLASVYRNPRWVGNVVCFWSISGGLDLPCFNRWLGFFSTVVCCKRPRAAALIKIGDRSGSKEPHRPQEWFQFYPARHGPLQIGAPSEDWTPDQ